MRRASTTRPSACSTRGSAALPWRARSPRSCRANPSSTWEIPARCPYGPRSLDEVDGFVQQIGAWLVERGVKLVVIACNTATAAGLAHAQRTFPVPVIGVVEPGARAAAHATKNRRVGVIATKATVESDAVR